MTISSEQASGTEVDSDRMHDGHETAWDAAARLLEIAASNADVLVQEARAEADEIVAQARARADELSARAEEQRAELDRAHRATLYELEERRVVLEAKVSQLAEFEHQHRNDLISYLNGQLESLQATDDQDR